MYVTSESTVFGRSFRSELFAVVDGDLFFLSDVARSYEDEVAMFRDDYVCVRVA